MQQVLLGLSAISTGLLTGAMLFIGLSVAPWLRSLSPAEFHTWILSYGPTILRAILPMDALSIVLALATLVFSRGHSVACRRLLMVAAACLVGGSVVHLGGNVRTSAALVGSLVLSKREEAAILGREILWHWLRVLSGLIAFLATLSAFRLREKELEERVQRERLDRLKRFFSPHVADLINDPVLVPNASERAVRMAVAMRARIQDLRVGWRKRRFELDFGVGIAQGYATIGAIGFEGRWDYGAIGTVTNLAARLCAEAMPGQILVSTRVLADTEDHVEAEPVGELQLKGFSKPVRAFQVIRLRADAGTERSRLPTAYGEVTIGPDGSV